MECLDASRLFELFAESASAESRAALDDHLDGCDGCRALVAAYARVADPTAVDDADTISPEGRTLPSVRPPPLSGPSPGQLVAGRYELERIVGEGGIGVVWAARDLHTDRLVALKMLKVDSREAAIRALREARIAQGIAHPNVVEILDVVAPPGAPPVLVMDLLHGESLDRLLSRRRTLPLEETLALVLPLVGALRTAHARGVVHRDLKPQNVFLAREPPTGGGEESDAPPVVMLLDFGLAKFLGDDVEVLTKTGTILGTPHYMAPEQLYGERDVDRRADVWAVGVIVHECLTGRRPLEGNSFAQMVRNASKKAIARLSERLPGAPPALASLVDRMLSHARDDRPELAEVHATLDALARSE